MKRLALLALVAVGIFVYFYPVTILVGNATLRIAWPEVHWSTIDFSKYFLQPIGAAVVMAVGLPFVFGWKVWDSGFKRTAKKILTYMGSVIIIIYVVMGFDLLFSSDFFASHYSVGPGSEDIYVNSNSLVKVSAPVLISSAASFRPFKLQTEEEVVSSTEQPRPMGWEGDYFETRGIQVSKMITATGAAPIYLRFVANDKTSVLIRSIGPISFWIGRVIFLAAVVFLSCAAGYIVFRQQK